jgi:hypothetical protein
VDYEEFSDKNPVSGHPCVSPDQVCLTLIKYDIISKKYLQEKQMKAVEVLGTIDEKGQLFLDRAIEDFPSSRVRVILLFAEVTEEVDTDPDDTPIAEVKASLRRALQQAKAGQTRPISELWERIDAE